MIGHQILSNDSKKGKLLIYTRLDSYLTYYFLLGATQGKVIQIIICNNKNNLFIY